MVASSPSVDAEESVTTSLVPEATYEDVLAVPKNRDTFLVDVREPQELLDNGIIPSSINVPLHRLNAAFNEQTTSEQFHELYASVKPAQDDPIIVTCRSGRRSELGAQLLIRLGFKNVKNYRGSWIDWAERSGLTTK